MRPAIGLGFLNGVPNPSDKALLEMGLQQDVVHSGDSGLRRYIVVGITRNEDNWRGYVAAAQSAGEIDTVYAGHLVVDHKAVSLI